MVYTTREYTQLQKAGLAVSLVAWGILLLRPAQAAGMVLIALATLGLRLGWRLSIRRASAA